MVLTVYHTGIIIIIPIVHRINFVHGHTDDKC